MENKNTIEVSLRWAISVVLGAVLTGLVGGSFFALRVANADHFTIIATASQVEDIKKDYVPRTEIEKRLDDIKSSLSEIKASLRDK